MAGTKIGGMRAKATNLKKNPNFYVELGRLGGKKGKTGGFYKNRELARIAGAKGGRVSKRNWTQEDKNRHAKIMRDSKQGVRAKFYEGPMTIGGGGIGTLNGGGGGGSGKWHTTETPVAQKIPVTYIEDNRPNWLKRILKRGT